jgi:flagellar assembly factor FliW
MPTTLHSSRFGTVDIPDDAVLAFPQGLVGLGGSSYALIAQEEDQAFVWLHSLEDPELALPVTNPWRFFPTYEVELADDEAERMGLDEQAKTSVYVTVRAGEQLSDFSANLAAPILICDGIGHQVMNQAAKSPVRASLFGDQVEVGAPKAA